VASRFHRAGASRRWFAHALTPVFAMLALAGVSPPAIAANPASPNQEAAAIGGPFTLVDQDGRTVTDETYRGKWLLVYFGYTHCPDTCPMALNNIAEALDQIDAGTRAKLQPIFITVDPERDTPAAMKDYVGAFEGAGIVGLSGPHQQEAAIKTALRNTPHSSD